MPGDFLMVFGGGVLQHSLVTTALRKGLRVLLLDPDPRAVAAEDSDVFCVVSGDDFDETLRLAKEYDVCGIVTAATDKPLLMMQRIASTLGLPFPSLAAVRATTHKDLLKAVLESEGLACARGSMVGSDGPHLERVQDLCYPLVVKPTDSSGSRGVSLVDNESELEVAIGEAFRQTRKGDVLAEEFIEGPEYSVESLTCSGHTTVVQITEKFTTGFPYLVEMGHVQPGALNPVSRKAIIEITKNLIQAIGLDHCACHTELKLTEQGPVIIENGCRLGGDFITSVLTPASTGVDMEAALIDIASGRKPDLKPKLDQGSAVRYLELPVGATVDEIADWSGLFDDTFVLSASLALKPGDRVGRITDSLNRYGHVAVEGGDREEALERADSGLETLKRAVRLTM